MNKDSIKTEKTFNSPGSIEGRISGLSELLGVPGRIAGIDFGDVRTGIALCEASRVLATGVAVISPGGLYRTAAAAAEMLKELGASAAVVGLPVNMDGSEGPRADRCRRFAEVLNAMCGLPVAMCDERLSTAAAARYLNETDTRGKERKRVIDALSAELILQSALDRLKRERERERQNGAEE